jgi:hypothetical protein
MFYTEGSAGDVLLGMFYRGFPTGDFLQGAAPLWAARHGLIGPDLLLENRKYQNEGFSMIQLQGGGTAAETRFAALWSRKS